MTTLADIRHAIERLSESEVAGLAAWLSEYRSRRTMGATGPHYDLDSLIGSWREDPAFDAAIRAFERLDEGAWKS